MKDRTAPIVARDEQILMAQECHEPGGGVNHGVWRQKDKRIDARTQKRKEDPRWGLDAKARWN